MTYFDHISLEDDSTNESLYIKQIQDNNLSEIENQTRI